MIRRMLDGRQAAARTIGRDPRGLALGALRPVDLQAFRRLASARRLDVALSAMAVVPFAGWVTG